MADTIDRLVGASLPPYDSNLQGAEAKKFGEAPMRRRFRFPQNRHEAIERL